MDPNTYLPRTYPNPPCWAMLSDVVLSETGQPVDEYKTLNNSIRAIADAFRLGLHKTPEGYSPVEEPVDLCIVLLGKSARLGLHHCGVYWQSSVLHALPAGNLLQDMASIRDEYALIEFWARP